MNEAGSDGFLPRFLYAYNRRMRIALLAAFCAGVALEPGPPPQNPSVETTHLIAVTSASTAAGKMLLHVDVSPKAKMHVYAPGEKDAIPVELKLDPNSAIKAGKVTFPPAEKDFFPPLQLTQLVYSKPFRITQPIAIARPPADGTLTITGTLRYQACDDAVCYIPRSNGGAEVGGEAAVNVRISSCSSSRPPLVSDSSTVSALII